MAHVQTINHLSLTIDHCVLRAHKFPFPCKGNNIPTHTEQMVQKNAAPLKEAAVLINRKP